MNIEAKELLSHRNHTLTVYSYVDGKEKIHTTLECEECNVVLCDLPVDAQKNENTTVWVLTILNGNTQNRYLFWHMGAAIAQLYEFVKQNWNTATEIPTEPDKAILQYFNRTEKDGYSMVKDEILLYPCFA